MMCQNKNSEAGKIQETWDTTFLFIPMTPLRIIRWCVILLLVTSRAHMEALIAYSLKTPPKEPKKGVQNTSTNFVTYHKTKCQASSIPCNVAKVGSPFACKSNQNDFEYVVVFLSILYKPKDSLERKTERWLMVVVVRLW